MIKTMMILLFLQNPQSLIQDARNLVKEGKYEIAREMYEKALNTEKLHPLEEYRTIMELVDIEIEHLDMYDDALKNLLYAKSLFSKNAHFQAEVFYRLGILYEKMGDYKKAAEFYQTVVTKYRKSKYWQDAFDAVERVFRKNVPEYVGKVGSIYITVPEFEKILENVPAFAKPRTNKDKVEFVDRILERKMLALEAKERKMYLKSSYLEKLYDVKENLLINVLSEEITNQVEVTTEEINIYYQEHLDEYRIPEKFKFARIEVKDKKLADEILLKLKKGEPAESLAFKYSTAPDAKKGGIVEAYTKGSFPQEYYEYLVNMKPGEVKGPIFIKSRKIYGIIKFIEKIPEKIRPLEEVENIIKNRLSTIKKRETWQNFIKRLKEKYNPENYLKKEK